MLLHMLFVKFSRTSFKSSAVKPSLMFDDEFEMGVLELGIGGKELEEMGKLVEEIVSVAWGFTLFPGQETEVVVIAVLNDDVEASVSATVEGLEGSDCKDLFDVVAVVSSDTGGIFKCSDFGLEFDFCFIFSIFKRSFLSFCLSEIS